MKRDVLDQEGEARLANRILADERDEAARRNDRIGVSGISGLQPVDQHIQVMPVGKTLLLERQFLGENRLQPFGHGAGGAGLIALTEIESVVLLGQGRLAEFVAVVAVRFPRFAALPRVIRQNLEKLAGRRG
jgi:hypothetical protein